MTPGGGERVEDVEPPRTADGVTATHRTALTRPWPCASDATARLVDVGRHPFVAPPAGHVDGPDVCATCGWYRHDPRRHTAPGEGAGARLAAHIAAAWPAIGTISVEDARALWESYGGPAGVHADGPADVDTVEVRTAHDDAAVRTYPATLDGYRSGGLDTLAARIEAAAPRGGAVAATTPAERTAAILAEYRERSAVVLAAHRARDRALEAHAVGHARATVARDVAAWGRGELAAFTGSDGGRHDHVLAYADGIIARIVAALDGETDPRALRFEPAMMPPRTTPTPAPAVEVLDGQASLPIAAAS